jgi:hypothetical protein
MCRCCDCVNKAHCVLHGSRGPCKYYIGPVKKETPSWTYDLAHGLPRPWHMPPRTRTKVTDSEKCSL